MNGENLKLNKFYCFEVPIRVPYPSNAVTLCQYLTLFIQDTTLDLYKIKGNPDLDKVFLALLDRYTNYVRKRRLPNYFMR